MKTGYRAELRSEIARRKTENPAYSLRAFARDLKVSPAALSSTLGEKRHLSHRNAKKVADYLALSPASCKRMFAEIQGWRQSELDKMDYNLIESDTFASISDWYHYAILNLAKIRTNRADADWIADRLGITPIEAQAAVERLVRLGYIQIQEGRMKRSVPIIDTEADVPSPALRKHHAGHLELGMKSLERDPVEVREFNTSTIATDATKLAEAKKMMRRFSTRLANYLKSDEPDQVYSLHVHLFPISKKESLDV